MRCKVPYFSVYVRRLNKTKAICLVFDLIRGQGEISSER